MLDEKIYNGEDGNEAGEWKRIFYVPQINANGVKINPFSQKSFLDKTKNVKTYGEAWDISKEFSDARADKIGAPDPQRQKAEDKFYRNKNKR